MTKEELRDHFAGLAMQTLITIDKNYHFHLTDIAKEAYLMANEMLEAREIYPSFRRKE